jgi:hypothetical protein
MVVKEAIRWFHKVKHTEKESQRGEISFILLEDGRLVPVERGGMVELALRELGAKVVEVKTPTDGQGSDTE